MKSNNIHWIWKVLGWEQWPCGCWAWGASMLPLHNCPNLPPLPPTPGDIEKKDEDDWHLRNMSALHPPL